MPRDRQGRFLPTQTERSEAMHWERVITLLERLVYNTAQTPLTYEEYLRQRVYKGTPHADHSAAD